ncbi:hypothetical protein BI347_20070 [Chromobacterium sphagni]|uniref:Uncharacterized protein n=2 Tax=Chromobacterium sphagni TaxID=1903179 RepID=A0A1S1WUA6_9NEIS|nr:hypothetical protein BI347_20070 [Chromobacterium sphagni]
MGPAALATARLSGVFHFAVSAVLAMSGQLLIDWRINHGEGSKQGLGAPASRIAKAAGVFGLAVGEERLVNLGLRSDAPQRLGASAAV